MQTLRARELRLKRQASNESLGGPSAKRSRVPIANENEPVNVPNLPSSSIGPSGSTISTSPSAMMVATRAESTSLPAVVVRVDEVPGLSSSGCISRNEASTQVPSVVATSQQDAVSDGKRPLRPHRLPLRFRDQLPESPPAAPVPPADTTGQPSLPKKVILLVADSLKTIFNSFGIGREYRHRPSYDPDSFVSADDLSSLPPRQEDPIAVDASSCEDIYGPSGARAPPWPWSNMSTWGLMTWRETGSNQKSNKEVNRLVHDVLRAPGFKIEDLSNFDVSYESRKQERARIDIEEPSSKLNMDNWKRTSVEIIIPTRERRPEAGGQAFVVPDLMYRSLTSVISTAFSEPVAKFFHLSPFKRIWKPSPTSPEQRLYDELYSTDAWIEAHNEVQKQKRQDNCQLERVIAGIMLWSDSTHLAQFGHSTAWPIYLFFGNLSKYIRSSPTSGACHPVALIPPLPQSLVKLITSLFKRKSSADVLAHCKRELFHAVWRVLLDDEFIEAYQNGIVVKCYDGIYRRVYPRIFTYSADYPEKILLATIRDKGYCPCPRCLIPKSKLWQVGFVYDLKARVSQVRTYLRAKVIAARDAIYRLGSPVKGTMVEDLLKEWSLVPTLNAFIERLSPFGFNLFPCIVVDFLHEFELGVLKQVLKHLVRILHSLDLSKPAILNERYSIIPPFGVDAIRCFPPDVANMRQRAARHFEDMIQCAIPAFEGLFPDNHNAAVTTLLFRLAEYLSFAKLRLHTDSSLELFQRSLIMLTTELRLFVKVTCATFQTKELPSEAAARWRHQQARTQSNGNASSSQGSPRRKTLNLNTYKFHALGDYVATVRLFGTTDSYTTQTGELAHRMFKKLYGLTSKRDVPQQLATRHRHCTCIQRQQQIGKPPTFETSDLDAIPELHHVLSNSPNHTVNLRKLLYDCRTRGDPAIKSDFMPRLKDHLLSRLCQYDYDGDERKFSDAERGHVHFINNLNRVIESKTFRINYTSYDVRRCQDFTRTDCGCMIMMLSRETGSDTHPFWYAEVLRAFLIPVIYAPPGAHSRCQQTMEVLWVRWLGVQPGYRWGFKEARLPKVGFVPGSDEGAFGFLDPTLVLRACHLMPVFSEGRTDALLPRGESLARPSGEVDDWSAFYVNIFADRDMFARFIGFGVGHQYQHNPSMVTAGIHDGDDGGSPVNATESIDLGQNELHRSDEATTTGVNIVDDSDGETEESNSDEDLDNHDYDSDDDCSEVDYEF